MQLMGFVSLDIQLTFKKNLRQSNVISLLHKFLISPLGIAYSLESLKNPSCIFEISKCDPPLYPNFVHFILDLYL